MNENVNNSLEESLKKYERIFNKQIMEYLRDLLNGEYSVLNLSATNLDYEVRSELANFEVYKRIIMANIYNRVLKVLDPYKSDVIIKSKRYENIFGVYKEVKQEIPNLRVSNMHGIDFYNFVHDNEIGKITVNMYVDNESEFDNSIQKLTKKYDELKGEYDEVRSSNLTIEDSVPTFGNFAGYSAPKCGGEYMDELYRLVRQMDQVKEKIKNMEELRKYREKLKVKYEQLEFLSSLILNDYGTEGDEEYQVNHINSSDSYVSRKGLINEYPCITLTKNINYY